MKSASAVERTVVASLAPTVDVGCDLLSSDGWTDISEVLDPSGSSVEHGSYRTIHRTCKVKLARQLDWGNARIRLRMSMTAGGVSFDTSLGVFLLSTPVVQAGEDPKTYDVEGYDLLELLDQPHGSTYVAAAGTGYLANARTLVEVAGLTVSFADEGADRMLGSARVWPLDEQTTTLNIVNDLLGAVGYRGLWVGPEGTARSEPYLSPADRGSEWTYDADADLTTVGMARSKTADFFDAPNRLVAVSDDPENPVGPVTLDNVSDGVTSQNARGRIIPTVVRFEAADLAGLTSQAEERFDVLSRVTDEFTVQVGPNPFHGHMDVVTYRDASLGVSARCLVRQWQLPLDGSDMRLDLRAVEDVPVLLDSAESWAELEATWATLAPTWSQL